MGAFKSSSPWKQKELSGFGIRLRPLTEQELDLHWAMAAPQASEIWRWFTSRVTNYEEFCRFYQSILEEARQSKRLAWSIYREGDLTAPLGSSSFLSLSPENKRLEIGSTWLYPEFHGTRVNTAAKLLLLDYAFNDLACHRVELKTDSLNVTSQKAMEAIGAKYEGTFRNHMLTEQGRIRHSVWYAFYREEWVDVRSFLLERISRKLSL